MARFAAVLLALAACGSFDAASTNPGDGGSVNGEGAPKLVFVAAAALKSTNVDQADPLCDALIKQVGPGRRAIAWVYHDGLTPLERMGPAEGPWATASGKLVFANRAALTSVAPSSSMSESADGGVLPGQKVWTGLHPDGGPSGLDCQRWKAEGSTDEATMGLTTAMTASWASSSKELCAGMHAVICFEY